ncbi:MAG: glycoside hydrolase family 127 protein, partial [Chloroflexi bacterium]|nr:glycoside hydrolase family 127 protein [Chloroflexota bacterium]
MDNRFTPLPCGSVRLLPGLFLSRYQLNRKYVLSLKTENLLQNHYMEAGLWNPSSRPPEDIHYGWESPTCQVRGHFLGHWLSAAAFMYANTGDHEVKGKADFIVSELARCQRENGGEWAGSIPEKYLEWAARGKPVWSPQYVLHKTLMGLWDMYAVGGNTQALDILVKWARWFHRWTGQFSLEQMDNLLDVETGGMLEVWANLYGATGEKEHYELIQRYDRRRLFNPLLEGRDVLTNMHMNTTIPEVHGAARAWEVTGEGRWREIVENYWRLGVTERGYYVTGGQTNGEVWSPPNRLSARLGFRTQEHCTVYNMMRLAEYLYRWTGDPVYAGYWERNLWNGILAQQHPDTGMIAYFLPLHAGAVKVWGTPTEDFWCCHGSLVQAHTIYANHIAYTDESGLALAQWIPSEIVWLSDGVPVKVHLEADPQLELAQRPQSNAYTVSVLSERPVEFSLRLRLPWWLGGKAEISIDGEPVAVDCAPSSYVDLRRVWSKETVHIILPKSLVAVPLPDAPGTCAFMD